MIVYRVTINVNGCNVVYNRSTKAEAERLASTMHGRLEEYDVLAALRAGHRREGRL